MAFIESYDRQVKAIKEELLRMCWFMRGGVSYDEMMAMSTSEREIIAKIIKDNLDTAKKTGTPFF